MASFSVNSSGPQSFTTGLQQLPTPISLPHQGSHGQITSPQYGTPQGQLSQLQHQPTQQQYQQSSQETQSPPAHLSQQPLAQHPMTAPPQQPLQYSPNMTAQQQQQVHKIIQNLPPEKLQMLQEQAQQITTSPPAMMSPDTYPQFQSPSPLSPPSLLQQHPPQKQQHYTTTAPSGLFGAKKKSKSSSSNHSANSPADSQHSDSVKRFIGDTLFGRIARSSLQTTNTFLKMPLSLSPWGDNNPVTLPNVRYRDAVLFTTFAFAGTPLVEGISDGVASTFGAESFVSEVVSSGAGAIVGSTVLKYGVFQIVEQAIDKGVLERLLPEEEGLLVTTDVKSLCVSVKHKLMGVDADLRFVGVRMPARDPQDCAKGWFCPYLFASARTPSVPRGNDWAVCQFFGPFLGGDYLLTHNLLSHTSHLLTLCDPNPTTDIHTNRLLVLFTAISPFRANIWSTSRRPGCATLNFHLFNGCPGLVIPVTNHAPICAWSPWTLSQMRNPGASGHAPEWQHEQICEWLDTVISLEHVTKGMRERYVDILGKGVSLVINGALALGKCAGGLMEKVDPERAGIVMFRY